MKKVNKEKKEMQLKEKKKRTTKMKKAKKLRILFEFHEEPGAAVSEDIWFCQQAQKAGIQVYADKRVACGHIIKEQYGFEEGF